MWRCQSRMGYCVSTGRGGAYEYFFCLGHHQRRTNCGLPHVGAAAVEAEVLRAWRGEVINEPILTPLRGMLEGDLERVMVTAESEKRRLTTLIAQLRRQRVKWAEKAAAEVVPDDIAREKQATLARQVGQAEVDLQRVLIVADDLRRELTKALDDARDCYQAYQGRQGADAAGLEPGLVERHRR